MNLHLLHLLTESVAEEAVDKFMDLFDNSTFDSVVLCTKGIGMLSKEISKAETAKTDKEKLRRYKLALAHAKRLKAEAKKIPPDKWSDHLLRVMKLSIGNIFNYTKAAVSEKDLKNMTRNDTLEKIDIVIKTIEARIDTHEKKAD